jgi:hypothetical protein
LRDEQEKRRYHRQLAGAYWLQRSSVAFWNLSDLPGGELWYDDDANVPSYGTARERTLIVENQIRSVASLPKYQARLYKDVFIWSQGVSAFVFQRNGKERWIPIAFTNTEAARVFVDGLNYSDIYGGFVVCTQSIEQSIDVPALEKAE